MAIITKLTLKRFKRFEDFSIDLDKFTVLVGENGCGKTTILDALYLAQRALRMVLGETGPPRFDRLKWELDLRQAVRYEVSPGSLEDIWFKRESTQFFELIVSYDNGLDYVLKSESKDRGVLRTELRRSDTSEKVPIGNAEYRAPAESIRSLAPAFFRPMATLEGAEQHMPYKNVRLQTDKGRLESVMRNFVFWQYDSNRARFTTSLEALSEKLPWAALRGPRLSRDDNEVRLAYEDDGVEYDVALGGGGLTTLLLLTAVTEVTQPLLALLDEPDAHLHSSLQSRVAKWLYEVAQEEGRQIVVATHAPDFIDAVPAECIRWIDRRKRRPRPVTSATLLLEALGALTKAQALQMRDVRVILWLEGESDKEILETLARLVDKAHIFGNPRLEVAYGIKEGHRDRLRVVLKMIPPLVGSEVRLIGMRDSDYERLVEDVPRCMHEKADGEARLFTLAKKEIENYFLDPEAIAGAYAAKASGRAPENLPSAEDIVSAVLQWAEEENVRKPLEEKFVEATERQAQGQERAVQARERFAALLSNDEWLYHSIPGKDALRALNSRFEGSTGVTLSAVDICEHTDPPEDLVKVLQAVEEALKAVENE